MKTKFKISNRLLSLVLALVMVLGMMPMMSMTAYAAASATSGLYTLTLDKETYSRYTSNIAGVKDVTVVTQSNNTLKVSFKYRTGTKWTGTYSVTVSNQDCTKDLSVNVTYHTGQNTSKEHKITGTLTRPAQASHTGGTANCTNGAACEVCGTTYGSPNNTHNWGEWTTENGTHSRTCTLNSSHKESGTCSGGTATCDSAPICPTCGKEYGSKLGHSYQYSANGNVITETCKNGCGHSAEAKLTASDTNYTGSPITTGASVTYSDGWAGSKEHGEITYSNNTNTGDAIAKVTVAGKELTTTFKINPADISKADVTVRPSRVKYGESAPIDVSVIWNGMKLVENTDYTVTWDKTPYNDAGTYTATIKGTGNFDGTNSGSFVVDGATLTDIKIEQIGTLTYNGSEQQPTVSASATTVDGSEATFTYSDMLNGPYGEMLYFTDADTYIVYYRVSAPNHQYDDHYFTVKVEQATNEWTTPPTISDWTYGETANEPTYKAKFGTVNVTYKGTTITGKEYPESTTPPTEAGSYTATFTVAETTNYSGLSETKGFTVSAASIKEATVSASDVVYTGKEQKPTVTVTLGGKTLTENTDYTVSYSGNTDLGTATVTVTGKGNYTDSASGSFKIDYLSTNAEAAVSGTEGANDWYIGTVTLTAPPAEYKISKTVNGEYTDTVSYDAEQNETVTYYLKNTSGEIAQKTLALKIDLTDPSAQYNIKGNGWREFVNFITFGIFCKDTADLTVKASDTMDSSVTVEYKISNTELTAENITDWTAYNGTVALNSQAKNYIYIKVTDDAGRTVVYESGVVVFADCDETVNIEYFKDTDKDITAQIDLKGNTVKEIKYSGVSLTNEQYTVTDDGITFAADYLDTFAASETPYTFTVSYHPMGVEMEANAEGDTPANTTISLTVKKQSGEVSNISELGKDYDGSAVSAPTYTSKSTGEATVEYKVKGTDDAAYSETAPKNAGTYVVRVKVAADENYNEAYATAEFTISKVTLTVTAENKDATYGGVVPEYTVTYDGFKGEDDKKVLGGTLEFECGYAQFSDKGEYTIKASGYTSDNYIIKYVDGKLTVGAKKITVTIDSKTSIYGDEIVALTATDNGIVNNDKDVYKLTTNASKTADVGKYDIIGEALDGNYSINFENETDAYEITTRELTVSVVVANKKYDGLNTAAITSAVLNNVANNDAVALVNGTATFTTVNVADGIAISLTDFALSGEADVLKNYTLTQPTGIKANITNDWTPTEYVVSTPNSNGWLNADLVITAKDGYELSLTNTADGVWSETLSGAVESEDSSVTFYVRNKADGTISLAKTENYKLDKNTEATTTTGKVEFVERNSWQEFVNNITFGLFFKDEVTVKAEATDALSEVASIEYAVSDKAMTLDEVKAITEWTAMPADGVGVTVEDAKKFVYFIRITDKAGNVTYLSTDGAEYDTTLPAISGIENGKTYYTTQVVTVEDKTLQA